MANIVCHQSVLAKAELFHEYFLMRNLHIVQIESSITILMEILFDKKDYRNDFIKM